ncbi:Hypothetical predicted protein [Podarcis lilfordi]|uniref:Uncharacterized protein n=1 Tax=Podarcis lilfordi TaxID=74358 RepID=A0AA35P4G2_9SAUR|nr:Hypothetical predicted protein [Podarcis lilfordi]
MVEKSLQTAMYFLLVNWSSFLYRNHAVIFMHPGPVANHADGCLIIFRKASRVPGVSCTAFVLLCLPHATLHGKLSDTTRVPDGLEVQPGKALSAMQAGRTHLH